MNCNMYTLSSAAENSCSQIYALENNTMQPIALDSDRFSDSLKCIVNDLNIGFPEVDQNTIEMRRDNVNTIKTSDTTFINSTLIQPNEENVQNFSSCPGKKISLSSTLNIQLIVSSLRSIKNFYMSIQ